MNAPIKQPDDAHAPLAGAVRTVSLMTLASRIGGLVRDVLLGRIFGATVIGSAFAAAFSIPNMFRRLFGEGALSAAFIPEYTTALRDDPRQADRLASLTVALLALVTASITVIIEVALLGAIWLTPPDPERTLSLELIMVMLPFMPLICVVAIQAGMLQVHGRFGPASSGPLLLNGFVIAVGGWCLWTGNLAGRSTAFVLGVATMLSAVTQCAWFFILLRPHVRWTAAFREARPRATSMLRKFVPVAIGMGTLQLNAFMDTLIAMYPIWVGPALLGRAYPMDGHSNIIIALTQRLYQFPLGVFGVAVATAAFPMLARHAHEPDKFAATLRRGLRLSLFIGLPASVGLCMIRAEATAVLYGYGRTGWTPEDLHRSALVLLGFAPAIWAYSLNHVLTRAFYARGDTRTPMTVSLWMVALNLGLNLALIWPLREAGLAWSTSIAAIVQCAVLSRLSRRLLDGAPPQGGHVIDGPTWKAFARIAAGSVLMAGFVWLTLSIMPVRDTWTGTVVRLSAGCSAGLASYLGLAVMTRTQELRWLLHRAR